MTYKGINYDTGFEPFDANNSSRKNFDIAIVRKELNIISNDLHCNYVRITGSDPKRITAAANEANQLGMKIWFAPFPCNLNKDELVSYFIICAKAAEELREYAPDIVLVLGCELSLFNDGFLPGDHLPERSQAFASFEKWQPEMDKQLADIFRDITATVRQHFNGKITYASGEWEDIDWSLFDIVGVDLYRAAHNKAHYKKQLEIYMSHNKPVAITEFGCCAVDGGADLGGTATFAILSVKEDRLVVNEGWKYNEDEQVNYLQELFGLFSETGVLVAFWFTFADYEKLYSHIQKDNLNMASYGLVSMLNHCGKTYPEMYWEPRKIFWEFSRM